jgi:PKD repeat protein
LILNTLDGASITKTITVTSTAVAPFTVALDKQEGLAPFTTNVMITNRGNVVFQRIELDLNDDGTPEQTLTTLTAGKAVQALTYNNAGTYTLRVTVYDASNAIIYIAKRKIRVYLSVELGLKVVNVYKSMVNRLIANNPTSALRCFTGDVQRRYQNIFDTLGSTLPSVALKLQTLIDGSVGEDTAELTILQDTTSDQEAIMIHMIRGGDGIWRIENM